MSAPLILVVDDHEPNLMLLADVLQLEGYRVAQAADAEAAVLAIARERPAAILMDIGLPGMDGLTLTRRLKADPATAGIPIAAVTAAAMKGDEEKALAAGCDAYIAKPIDTRALPRHVAALLGPSAGAPTPVRIEPPAARPAAPVPGPVAESGRTPAVRRRLLIVDDVAANRMLLRAVLELAGHEVVETTDGREALDALERGSFDAMITDALMPNMDGFRLCLELRKRPRFVRLPIVIYTSTYDSPSDRALAERVGADRYLVKPAAPERILATIEDAIREAPGRPLRPPPPPIEEVALVREYNVALITKLEQRNDELTTALEALRRVGEQFRALVEISAQIVWTTGPDGMAIADSPSWRAFTGQSFEEGRGSGWLDAIHPDDRAGVVRRWQQLVASGSPAQFEYRLRHAGGGWRWTQVRAVCLKHADGTPREWVGMNMDIEEQKKADALLAGQRQILELISTGTPLERTLDALIRLIEAQSPRTLGAVLLLDEDAGQLRCCAAPTLPAGYVAELERIPIRAAAGSSGTAAFRLQPVVVSDIAADPLWVDDRESALRHGLRACWATPILNSRQRLLGIFAIYYREPGAPPAADAPLVEVATHLAAIAIGRHQTETKNREQLDELRRWQDVMLEREGRIQELKAEVNDVLARRGEPLRYADPGPLPS